MEPIPSVVEWLSEEIARGWIDALPHAPESEIDAVLVGCRLAALASLPEGGDPRWMIHGVDIDGEAVDAGPAAAVAACKPDQSVGIDGTVSGITARVFVRGSTAAGMFDCECVYWHRPSPPTHIGDPAFMQRILEWCEAVVALGSLLGADRVEVPGRYDARPVILAERSDG